MRRRVARDISAECHHGRLSIIRWMRGIVRACTLLRPLLIGPRDRLFQSCGHRCLLQIRFFWARCCIHDSIVVCRHDGRCPIRAAHSQIPTQSNRTSKGIVPQIGYGRQSFLVPLSAADHRPGGRSPAASVRLLTGTLVPWRYARKSCNSSPANTVMVHAIEASTRTISRVTKDRRRCMTPPPTYEAIARQPSPSAGRRANANIDSCQNADIEAGKTGNVGPVVNRT